MRVVPPRSSSATLPVTKRSRTASKEMRTENFVNVVKRAYVRITRANAKRKLTRRAHQARQYLREEPSTDDLLAHLRLRAQSAENLLRDPVFSETIQAINESIVAEIATADISPTKSKERDMLFLKLQLVSEFQSQLMQHVSDYESTAVIKEAELRAAQEAQADSDAYESGMARGVI